MSSKWMVRERVVKVVSISLLLGIILSSALSVLPANADLKGENVIDRPADTVTSDALPTTQIDGIVWDQLIVSGIVYAGGEFANARPAGALPGINEVPRSNLLAYDLTSGILDDSFAPAINGKVKSLAVSPDGSRLFVGGNFTQVNGQPRNRIAAFKLPEGILDDSFKPDVNNQVDAVTVNGSTVYFGGQFSTVNGVPRTRLAAVDLATDQLTGWAPSADFYVNGMALTPDGSKIALGGSFSNINGAPSPGLAFVSVADGTLTPFAANKVVKNYGTMSGIFGLKSDGKNILATGWWVGGAGGNFEGALSADPVTGEIRWMTDCHGDTYDATTMGEITYTVSHSHTCSNMGAYPELSPRTYQRAYAVVDRASTTTRHDSQGYFDFFGQPAPTQINWYPKFEAGNVSGSWQAAWSAESNDNYLVLGGEFLRVNGVRQQGLVRFAKPGTAPSRNAPSLSNEWNPSAVASGASIRVSWPANYDTDNLNLTYRLYRTDKPKIPLVTLESASTWWNAPRMFWTDSDLVQGQSYTYKVTASDPDGNVAISNTVTLVAGSDSIPTTNYSQAVSRDGADHYWRLLESSGSRTSVDWRGGNDLTLGREVTLGQPGAMPDTTDSAAALTGTQRSVSGSISPEAAASTYSVELWFKSTATTGGTMLGFGKRLDNRKWEYDRYVAMDPSGKINFGVNPETPKIISTSNSYNDGQWHHLIASLSEAGQVLWVDGRAVAADPSVVSFESDINGYWRLGGDDIVSWPDTAQFNQYFAGTIDEVATYRTALTQEQVRAHYTASGRTLNLPPPPSDVYGKAVVADFPAMFWRLNESQGVIASDATDNLVNGTYFGNPGFGSPSEVADGTAIRISDNSGVVSDALIASPKVFSMETWFQSTSTTGGVLMNFGSARTGFSPTHDRQIWLDGTGRIRFKPSALQNNEISSPPGLNDGKWHHVVATFGSAEAALYVDGVRVDATLNAVAENYFGYWRIGGDASWEGQPWFNGSIDETAIYSGILNVDQIRSHYRASSASMNRPPQPFFTVNCAQETCHFDGSTSIDSDGEIGSYTWDFGDGTRSSGVTTSRTYTAPGTYKVTLTVIDDQRAQGSVSQDIYVVIGNVLPVASFTSHCDGLKCSFDGSGSTDSDGVISSYDWDFGDGVTGEGAVVEHVFGLAGTHRVALKVADDRGGAVTSVAEIKVDEPRKIVAQEFRQDGSGWGQTDTGEIWTYPMAARSFSVNSERGLVQMSAARNSRAVLNEAAVADGTVQMDLSLDKIPTGTGAYTTLLIRYREEDWYGLGVRWMPDGSYSLIVYRTLSRETTTLQEVTVNGAQYSPGTVLHVKFSARGQGTTTLSGTAWMDGSPEPNAPQITATDSTAVLQKAGGIGINAYLSGLAVNAPIVLGVDNLMATKD